MQKGGHGKVFVSQRQAVARKVVVLRAEENARNTGKKGKNNKKKIQRQNIERHWTQRYLRRENGKERKAGKQKGGTRKVGRINIR